MTPEFELLRAEIRELRAALPAEHWLDKRGLAEHLACSVRSVEAAMAEGMPHAIIFGRAKFKVSLVEPWLAAHGYLHPPSSGDTLVTGSENGPAPLTRPGPDHRR